jgi:beta-galactosidase/beta-glucuronidase
MPESAARKLENTNMENTNMETTTPGIPRPEYPRPQLVRPDWMNLNGTWAFEMDHGRSGRARGLDKTAALSGTIVVPFCPESELSGVGHKDFMASVWYKRTVVLPRTWLSGRVLLHFGAVDYDTEVFVNGVSAGRHRGGYASFSFDITELVKPGENVLTVCAEDDNRSGLQPRGKQSALYHSHACDYTRTTGIWQTVWLESVPDTYLQTVKYVPDPANAVVHVEALLNRPATGGCLTARASLNGEAAGLGTGIVTGNRCRLTLPLSVCRLWEPGAPHLYDLSLTLSGNGADGESLSDQVDSYFGLRSVSWDGHSIQINGRPVFQRLILDQGFWPDGIYTAPSDDELRRDIERGMAMGFNGARMHEKIFEARYLYWADRLGYLVWGEQANWGLDITGPMGLERFLPEWLEAVRRDFNSPALVGWCPFNETWDERREGGIGSIPQDDEVLRQIYLVTKALDPTRPVIDTSGNYHVVTDVFDIHDYEQDVAAFAAKFEDMRTGGRMQPDGTMESGGTVYTTYPDRQRYGGQPYFVSEYGGIWWNPAQAGSASWGYGSRPRSEEEFLDRFAGLTNALLDNPNICALCYTQLTDVEQETNGLYTYAREPKFNPGFIRGIVSRKAAIEG